VIRLTPRQQEVVRHHANGLNGNETAQEMGVSNQVVYLLRRHVVDNYGSLDAAVPHIDMSLDHLLDEIPDDDEPFGPFRRCQQCDLVMPCHHEPISLIKANDPDPTYISSEACAESVLLPGTQGEKGSKKRKAA